MLVCQCVSPTILLLLGVQQATSHDGDQLFASNVANNMEYTAGICVSVCIIIMCHVFLCMHNLPGTYSVYQL